METNRAPLLRAEHVAERLSVTKARVYELARYGTLPTVRIGRQVRFDPDALERWIEGGGSGVNDAGQLFRV